MTILKLIFSKWPPPHMQPHKHATSTCFGVETWFQYQNNKQNLQIWDMQISQIAKFLVKTHFVRTGHIFAVRRVSVVTKRMGDRYVWCKVCLESSSESKFSNSVQTLRKSFRDETIIIKPRFSVCIRKQQKRSHTHVKDPVVHVSRWTMETQE